MTISIQQHPRQNAPCDAPARVGPKGPCRQYRVRKSSGDQQCRSFEWLEENAGSVPEKQLSVPDIAGEHGVGGVPCLLPDLERGDTRPSRARREAGAYPVGSNPAAANGPRSLWSIPPGRAPSCVPTPHIPEKSERLPGRGVATGWAILQTKASRFLLSRTST
jgi:hypothetical protein